MPWRERGHTAPGEGRGNGMGTVFRQTSRKNIPGINRAAHIPLRFFLPSPDRFPGIKRIAMSLLLQVQTSGIGFHSGKKQGYAGKFGPSGIPVLSMSPGSRKENCPLFQRAGHMAGNKGCSGCAVCHVPMAGIDIPIFSGRGHRCFGPAKGTAQKRKAWHYIETHFHIIKEQGLLFTIALSWAGNEIFDSNLS